MNESGAVNWLAVIAVCALVAVAILIFGTPDLDWGKGH